MLKNPPGHGLDPEYGASTGPKVTGSGLRTAFGAWLEPSEAPWADFFNSLGRYTTRYVPMRLRVALRAGEWFLISRQRPTSARGRYRARPLKNVAQRSDPPPRNRSGSPSCDDRTREDDQGCGCGRNRRAVGASGAPFGHGRRPHPRLRSSRFRFCPAAISSASALTFQSPGRRNRFRPCQSLASPKSGSTHTLRLRMAF